jgi:hypothetical protein
MRYDLEFIIFANHSRGTGEVFGSKTTGLATPYIGRFEGS